MIGAAKNTDQSSNSIEIVDLHEGPEETVGDGAGSDVACEGAEKADNAGVSSNVSGEERMVEEPFVGMAFDSEEAAKLFYDDYAKRTGFVMRIDHCRRNEEKKIICRQLTCNKQGYYTNKKEKYGPLRKQYTSSRQGCNATMLVRVNKSGKWVVSRFVKEHTHPLVLPIRHSFIGPDAKERRIQALTSELKHQERLCDFYREQLMSFMRDLDKHNDHLSTKIEEVVNNIRELETENSSDCHKCKQICLEAQDKPREQ